jgi:hypothetical protein
MGKLVERLTQTEIQTIERYIDRYAGEGSNSRKSDVPYILRFWDDAKSEYLADMFKDKFIVEKKIEYKKPISTLRDEFNDAFRDKENALYKFKRVFSVFLWENKESLGEDYYKLTNLLYEDALARSEYIDGLFSVMNKDGYEIKVQSGCKPVKIIGKIIHSYGQYLNEFEEFRLECSRILNQKKLTGTLCMSIHPLDYMTMSDNENDWSSCMSWKETGCYRQGTVEMMNSPMVVVGYLKSDNENMNLYSMEWNSKKWRELFIVTPELICGVKGYPYQNEQLVRAGIDMLKDLAKDGLGWSYRETKPFDNDRYYTLNYDDISCEFTFSTGYMYNDFGTTTHYGAACIGAENLSEVTNIYYSGKDECMCCGETGNEFSDEGCLICEECDNRVACDYCGDVYDEEDLYELDGRMLCEYCYNNHAQTDPITDEDHYDDDFHTIYLVPTETEDTDKITQWGYSVSVWDGAEDSNCFEDFFSDEYRVSMGWRSLRYVTPDVCTKDGLSLFDIYDEDDMTQFREYWASNTSQTEVF